MKSLRLNKKGETIPSVVKPSSYSSYDDEVGERYAQYMRPAWNPPVQRIVDARAYGRQLEDLPDDLDVPARSPLVVLTPERLVAQREAKLLSFMAQKGRFSVGDWVCDMYHAPDGSTLTKYVVYNIIHIERRPEHVVWKQGYPNPYPFLMVAIPPMPTRDATGKFLFRGFIRFTDLNMKRHLTVNEIKRLVEKDDIVPDYLKQIKAAFEAGSLDVS
jgi:hypothetical protein